MRRSEKYGRRDSRLIINHLQVVSPDLFEKMKKYDIVGYIQPVFVASDKDVIEKLMGKEVAARSYMWKTMADAGILCCGGSDAPVESFDVLSNIQLAVTRDRIGEDTGGWHPEEKLSVDEALRLFTINNARGSFTEDKRGSLEVGKDADITILEEDIYRTDPHRISEIKIEAAIVAGKEVYRS